MISPRTSLCIADEMTGSRRVVRTDLPVELLISKMSWGIVEYLFPEQDLADDFGCCEESDGDTLLCDPSKPPTDLAAAMHIYEDGTVLIRFHAIGDALRAERSMLNAEIPGVGLVNGAQ